MLFKEFFFINSRVFHNRVVVILIFVKLVILEPLNPGVCNSRIVHTRRIVILERSHPGFVIQDRSYNGVCNFKPFIPRGL